MDCQQNAILGFHTSYFPFNVENSLIELNPKLIQYCSFISSIVNEYIIEAFLHLI